MQQEIPQEKLSRVYSYDALGSFVLVPLGLIVAGPLAEAIGVDATLWGAAAIAIVVVLADARSSATCARWNGGPPSRKVAGMPAAAVTPEIDAFLREPNPAVVATLRADGSPRSVPTWYDWDDGLVLLNMDATRKRLEHLRRDPRVSLTVLQKDEWSTHVTLFGVVEPLEDDPELADIDRLSLRYQGSRFRNRESRAGQRLDAASRSRTRAYAQPVTSQRRPEKRQDISVSRTPISTTSAAHTPTIPQSNASAASETTAQTANAATIDHVRNARRWRRSGCRRAQRRRRSAAASARTGARSPGSARRRARRS